jgi:hypothetical protein
MKQKCLIHFCNTALLLILATGCMSKREQPISTNESQVLQTQPQIPKNEISISNAVPFETNLFNGKDLTGWKKTDFGGHGEIEVENGEIKVLMGAELNGINWTNAAILPKTNFEIELDAMKLQGSDFFCALTFPFSNSFCSLVVGGWGGGIVGISSINGADASENDTTRNLYFEKNRWFHIRVRVTPQKIMAWIDQDNVVDIAVEGRKVSMRGGEIEMSIPLGIATWQTSAAYKNIKLKAF